MARSPVLLGLLGLTGAVVAGLSYMAAQGAPRTGMMLNAAALVAAMAIAASASRVRLGQFAATAVIAAIAVSLLATAMVGAAVDDVRRWIAIGPLTFHWAMLTCPALIVLHARRDPTALTAGAMATVALALALQPDRGSALALLAASVAIATVRRTRLDVVVVTAALAALIATLVRPDPLAGVAFVERVLADSWAASPLWGLVLTAAASLLLLPLAAFTHVPHDARAALAGWMAWTIGLLAASLLGDYPTPAIGIGASAIVGHGLALALLRNNNGDCIV